MPNRDRAPREPMAPSLAVITFLALSIALWLALSMPGTEFFRRAWIPAGGWLLLLPLALSPRLLCAIFRVDAATYDSLAIAFGGFVPALGAAFAAALLVVARYAGTGSDQSGHWSTSPVLGAAFILILLGTVIPISLMSSRSIGRAGAEPSMDPRDTMGSHAEPPRSESDLADRRPGNPPNN